MSTEANKALIRRHFAEIWNRRQLDVADELVAPDYHSHSPVPGQPPGIAGFKYAVRFLHTSFPDLTIAVEDLIAEDDKVVARLTARGTHQGAFRGIPPTGRMVTWTGIRIFRIANGKIVEHWANWNDLGLLQQLGTTLALEQGMSVFVLGPGADMEGDLRRFAEEVAPGVREAVARARTDGRPSQPTAESAPPVLTAAPTVAVTPRRAGSMPRSVALDEQARPHLPHNAEAPVTAIGRQSQETLLHVHEHLRRELAQIREAAAAVAAGGMEPAQARSLIYRTTMRQNYWTLGAFCAQYCRVVSIHHTVEDEHLFPSLGREETSLGPVLERLHWEHEVIAAQLDRFDRALVGMMDDPGKVEDMRRLADELGDMLLSHLAYEEDELLGPLGRLEIMV